MNDNQIVFGILTDYYGSVVSVFSSREKAISYLESIPKDLYDFHPEDCTNKPEGRWLDNEEFEIYCPSCKWKNNNNYWLECFDFDPVIDENA